MSAQPYLLTTQGKRQLEQELNHLLGIRRPQVEELLRRAGEDGDVENAAYHDAQHQLALLQGRIQRLASVLNHAETVDAGQASVDGHASVGSKVTVGWQDGTEEEFVLVGSLEADPSNRRISNESPVGKALLGRAAGAQVEVATPASTLRFTIKSVA